MIKCSEHTASDTDSPHLSVTIYHTNAKLHQPLPYLASVIGIHQSQVSWHYSTLSEHYTHVIGPSFNLLI